MGSISYPFGISLRPTPWDAKALGVDTCEVLLENIDEFDEANVVAVLNELTSTKNSSLYYCRTNANLNKNKRILYQSGFCNHETQLHIVNNGIKNFDTPKELGKRRLQVAAASDQDYIEIAKKSSDVFKYSRFHEDPFVKTELANLRMRFWCEDMHKKSIPLLVYRNKANELDSFIFYKYIDEHAVELILGGSVPGKGMMTPLFWASFIEYFKNLGITRIETKISASNITIVNIYCFFNFTVKATYFDFHKHIIL